MTCYLLTRSGADVGAELAEGAENTVTAIFDHQADAERHADARTPDGESWREHWTLYEVRPVS